MKSAFDALLTRGVKGIIVCSEKGIRQAGFNQIETWVIASVIATSMRSTGNVQGQSHNAGS